MNVRLRDQLPLIGISSAIVLIAVVMVVSSLRAPELPAYVPTIAQPRPVGKALVGPLQYTIDAATDDGWHFFNFSVGAEVPESDALGWDLAFRRFNIIANGGRGFSGTGGILDLGLAHLDTSGSVPASGYHATEAGRDSINQGAVRWYDYGFTTHVLTSRAHAYAIRTADDRYAKLEIMSYYCPGARPGCVTFRYVYQGDGSRSLPTLYPDTSAEPGSP